MIAKPDRRRFIFAVIPIIACNIVAFIGQFEFIRDHLHWALPGQVLFAGALESIAVYLAFAAHDALMSEDSAFRLRMGSYAFALVIGILNYSHYAGSHFRPTFAAIGTGLMSAISPALWGIYSRRLSRNALKEKGLVESIAVRLGFTRWLYWPRESFQVFRMAVWTGERNPATAIAEWEKRKEIAEMEKELAETAQDAHTPRMTLETAASKADAVRVALAELGETLTASAVTAWLQDRGWSVTPAYVRNIRSAQARRLPAQGYPAIAAAPEPGDREP
jgi:hypothetical protein